jgi:hypothetical protein
LITLHSNLNQLQRNFSKNLGQGDYELILVDKGEIGGIEGEIPNSSEVIL